MNTDTGQVYEGKEAIDAALLRGEPVVPVSERVARLMRTGVRVEKHREQKQAKNAGSARRNRRREEKKGRKAARRR